jgi:IS5 family transposase
LDHDRGSIVVRSAGVLVTRNLQPSLWDSVLPAEVRRLSSLLEQVDQWLDDEAFFAPFRC